jgi:hypothetical protein
MLKYIHGKNIFLRQRLKTLFHFMCFFLILKTEEMNVLEAFWSVKLCKVSHTFSQKIPYYVMYGLIDIVYLVRILDMLHFNT